MKTALKARHSPWTNHAPSVASWGHAVAVAIANTYAAREAHETELRAKVPNVGALRALSIGLADARKAESDAVGTMPA